MPRERFSRSVNSHTHATADNAIAALQRAEAVATAHRSHIREINTDQGSQFYASGGEKKRKGISRFERYLNARGINHIPSKRNNPQTNGKIERGFQEYKRHRWRFDSAYAFETWYNGRIHGALDLECFENPNEAFIKKMRSESILGMFLEWNEKEVCL